MFNGIVYTLFHVYGEITKVSPSRESLLPQRGPGRKCWPKDAVLACALLVALYGLGVYLEASVAGVSSQASPLG